MANVSAILTVTSSETGCGCCTPDPKTAADVIRELESRRESLETRLTRLESR